MDQVKPSSTLLLSCIKLLSGLHQSAPHFLNEVHDETRELLQAAHIDQLAERVQEVCNVKYGAKTRFKMGAVRAVGQFVLVPTIEIANEEVLLNQHFVEFKIKDRDERAMVESLLSFALQNTILIKATLETFYATSVRKFQAKDDAFFTALLFIFLHKVSELSNDQLTGWIQNLPEQRKSFHFLKFLFDVDHCETLLKRLWENIYHGKHVQEKLLSPVLDCIELVHNAMQEMENVDLTGAIPTNTMPTTQVKPFVLTVPTPRRIPEPEPIPCVPPPKEVPQSTYQKSRSQSVLAVLKKKQREAIYAKYANPPPLHVIQDAERRITEKREKGEQSTSSKMRQSAYVLNQQVTTKRIPDFKSQKVNVKLNTAAILRDDALVRRQREAELKALEQQSLELHDASEFMQWQEEMRAKDERQKKLELEKKRLEIQMHHEDAQIARQEKIKENKALAEDMKEEQEVLKQLAEEREREQEELNKKKIEEVQQVLENARKAKERILEENQKNAEKLAAENERLLAEAAKQAQEELERKAELIKKIRALENLPIERDRSLDLTATPGHGLMSEMSIAELRERLVHLNTLVAEDIAKRRATIFTEKQIREKALKEKSDALALHRQKQERVKAHTARQRTAHKQSLNGAVMRAQEPELLALQTQLMKKRQQARAKLATPRTTQRERVEQEAKQPKVQRQHPVTSAGLWRELNV